ncbi:TetR/AcrR family transcriptional regulator [Mycolicibacterium sp. YH-1]|uniref:TetR/AcrR family transcriptional regulator n=1 Tax=Mycolicibacterium sp. YH-1 TaxID=2908837 RepID=UPI001F4C0E19|nr:TetR/AcrR family transcriptional regulator [Mycolicibacterium sp. YH-1]UNB52923.1 TetR/AcrR family transcriptional regulator [Mycolicibacterium sp. YH-1]
MEPHTITVVNGEDIAVVYDVYMAAGRTNNGNVDTGQAVVETPTERTPQLRRKAPLSEDTIVECALALVQEEGSSALSLRRIGRELGVDATAFYRHFRNKDDLVLACMDRVLAIAYQSFVHKADSLEEPLNWKATLSLAAHTFFTVSQDFPTVTALGFSRVTGGDGERKWIELFVSTLASLGLDERMTALHYRALVDTMLSLAALRAGVIALTPDLALKDRTAWSRIYAHLPEDKHPATRAHAPELERVTPEGVFRTVIDGLLGAIEATLAPPPK